MATTARLGIDITATDRTRAAFASTQRGMQNMQRSMNQLKGAFAGIVGGNILAGMVRSLVEVNKHVEPVKSAFTTLGRAWQAFALQVGQGGLNEALVQFVTRISQMIVGSDRLANSLGSVLNVVVRGMSRAFEGLGRAIGFVYDNFEILKKVVIGFFAIQAAEKIITISVAFVKMISAIRAASIATALFHLIQRRMLLVWVAIIAVGAKLTGTFDKLQQFINKATDWALELIPTMGEGVALALRKMGLDVTALTEDFDNFNGTLKNLPQTFAEIEAGQKAMKPYERIITDLRQYVQGIKDQTAAVGMSEGALARLAASQEFYNKVQDKGIKLTAAQRAEAEALLNQVPDAISKLNEQRSNLEMLQDIGQSFADTITDGFMSIVEGSKSVGAAVSDMTKQLIASLTRLALNKVFDNLLNGAGGNGGIIGQAFAGMFGGKRAAGGPVHPGRAYLVGEKGPELFAPSASGTIIPNRSGGGSGGNIYISNHGAQVEAKPRRRPDGERDWVIKVRSVVAEEIADPYSQSAVALGSRGAKNPVKRR